jgi:UDPglucose 6-dehydrogenase
MIKINVIGSGVVGYATGKGFLKRGFDVTFVDVNPTRIDQIKSEGLQAISVNELKETKYKKSDEVVNFLAVPTPTVDKQVDLQYLESAVSELAVVLKNNKNYQVIVTRSTLPPGTTVKLSKKVEELSGKKVGDDFGLCMNPEYLRAYKAVEDFDNPWIVVVGAHDDRSYELLAKVYKDFAPEVHRLTIEEAEFQKYVHNLLNAAKISFFNEMREIGKSLSLDTDKVFKLVAKSAEALWNPLYGTKDMGPYGGVCLPKDTQGFLTWAEANGHDPVHLRATIEVNNRLLQNTNVNIEEKENDIVL